MRLKLYFPASVQNAVHTTPKLKYETAGSCRGDNYGQERWLELIGKVDKENTGKTVSGCKG